MEEVYTLKEAVLWKGNEAQINKVRTDGKLPSNQLRSLLKRFSEEYHCVTTEGKGKNLEIVVSEKRITPIKLDKRKNNSGEGRKTPFANELELLIIKSLRESDNRSIEGSVGNIMQATSMAHEKLCYFKRPNRVELYIKDLQDLDVDVDKQFLVHVLSKEHSVLTTALLTALNRLGKKKLLSWTKKKIGAVKSFEPKVGKLSGKPIIDDEGNPIGRINFDYITLTNEQEIKLAQIDRELATKHNVKTFELLHYENSRKVRAFMCERKALYKEMGIEFHFDSYCIQLLASETEVDMLLETNDWMLEEVYLKKATIYAVGKAEKRQLDYTLKTFGQLNEFTPVKQYLAEGLYVDKYKTTLKHTFLGPEYEELLD